MDKDKLENTPLNETPYYLQREANKKEFIKECSKIKKIDLIEQMFRDKEDNKALQLFYKNVSISTENISTYAKLMKSVRVVELEIEELGIEKVKEKQKENKKNEAKNNTKTVKRTNTPTKS